MTPEGTKKQRELPGLCNGCPNHDRLQILTIFPSVNDKEIWHARSPDLNPLDFSILSILEIKACSSPHPTVEALKAKLVKELAAIPQETIRRMCLVLSQIEGHS